MLSTGHVVFQITGQEEAMYQARVIETTKGRKTDLPVKSGDVVSIIRTTKCPKGKWLARDSSSNCESATRMKGSRRKSCFLKRACVFVLQTGMLLWGMWSWTLRRCWSWERKHHERAAATSWR